MASYGLLVRWVEGEGEGGAYDGDVDDEIDERTSKKNHAIEKKK